MKKVVQFSLFILLICVFIISCSSDKKTNPDTEVPTVVITYPINNAVITSGEVINIVAEANDNVEVEKVEFYIDDVKSFEDISEPYEYSWDTAGLNGVFTIYAKAIDSSENSAISDLLSITIFNNPCQPSDPIPFDNAYSASINSTLSWICTHPNGDTLTYDIYFGTSSNPSLVNIGQTENYYDPGDLIDEMTYYWKIKAYDDDLNSTTSDIWEFTTTSVSDFDWCDVTAGEYTYGSSSQILEIDYNFQIMKYEVTNNQYLVYIESALNAGQIFVTSSSVEGHYVGDQHFSEGLYEFLDLNSIYCKIEWNGNSFNVISGYENHPVVEVSWFGSWAFAEFYDFRLPTEYEWEKAARGNTGYCWPWGNDIVIGRANFEGDGDPFEENEVATTPVGFYNGQIFQGFATIDSPSPYGAYDIAGNVIEWTDSWWSVNLTTYRVYRSGSWTSSPYMCYCFDRWGANPSSSSWTTGFRCVFQ